MKRTNDVKRLVISKETVRTLTEAEQRRAVGGDDDGGVCSTGAGTRMSDCHCPTRAVWLCPQQTDDCAPNTLERNCA